MTEARGTIAVTGAAGGIGRALCEVLRARGWDLHLVDREESDVEALAASIGVSAAAVTTASAADARRALAPAEGPLQGLVHLAGSMEDDPDLGDAPEVWERAMADNLRNAYDFATALEPRLPEGRMGRLVFASSLAFRRGAKDAVAYSAAKGGLVGLTRALARRFRTKATVNALAPGIILTRMPQRLIELPHIEYVREAGAEGIELVMWLIMRGALDKDITEVYRHYHVPASNTATGLIIFENEAERAALARAG